MVDWAEVEMQQKYLAKIHTEDFPVNKPGLIFLSIAVLCTIV